MRQFTVPQFIDVEDKIIGPVTSRQFIIMLSGSALIGVSYKIFDFSAFIAVGLLILIIFTIFAFVKINGSQFHLFLLNVAQTLKRPRLRIWNHTISKTALEYNPEEEKEIKDIPLAPVKHYSASRLSELALMVDTKGAYRGEEKNK